MKTRTVWLRHPDEDALENYARHKLSELESGSLEAHLLACCTCQDALAEIDAFILAVKENAMAPEPSPSMTNLFPVKTPPVRFEPVLHPPDAVQLSRVDAVERLPTKGSSASREGVRARAGLPDGTGLKWLRGWRSPIPGRATIGRAVLAGATALLCAVAVFHRAPAVLGPPAAVTLTAFRGGGLTQSATAPAGHPLALVIEAVDVPAATQCRVEIVNATGRLVWSGVATAAEGQVNLSVPEPLDAGIYWVRLYTTGSDPIREFGLRLK